MTAPAKKRTAKHPKKKGPKRHLRKSLIAALVICIAALFAAIKIPGMVTDSSLRSLGYSEQAVTAINKAKLSSTILSNQYYSDYLNQCFIDGTVNTNYLFLYADVSSDRGLTSDDLLLYDRLLDKGYEQDQLENLFSKLEFWEITPLLIYDYQWDETNYVADCLKHHDTNSISSFTLSGSYYTAYKIDTTVTEPNETTLVNATYGLPSTYVPDGLTSISTEYAASGQSLCSDAADAFLNMAKDALSAGHPFFCSASYRSYEDQASSWNTFYYQVGKTKADSYAARAGHSEHQTGLSVNVSCTYEDNENFTSTQVYQWLIDNCASYGFIQRYPDEKSEITGMDGEPNHFRYVGKELAQKIKDSGLTYDEYYLLYLADWYDEASLPDQSIINDTGTSITIQSTPEPTASAETTAAAE